MTRFYAIYTGRLLRHTMKFTSFPISDAWLIKVATCVIFNPLNPPYQGDLWTNCVSPTLLERQALSISISVL